ncbi:MAG: dihydropteridine reductase [Clostridia bacterium]|nr:dihydropteridine reductase [Clostridia bacterium]
MKNPNAIFAEKIVSEYSENSKPESKVSALKKLDQKVKRPAEIFAYTYGIIGSLILGTGMSLAMNVIGNFAGQMIVGIVVGLIGIFMMATNHIFYKKILAKGKKKYAFEIVELAKEIVNEENVEGQDE